MAAREKVDLQVRGVPVRLQRRIREKAARKGMSMSKYVIEVLEDNVDRSGTLGEWLAAIEKDPPRTNLRRGEAAASVRAIRDAIERA